MKRLTKILMLLFVVCASNPGWGQNLYFLRASAEPYVVFFKKPPLQVIRYNGNNRDSSLTVYKDFTQRVLKNPEELDIQYYPLMNAFCFNNLTNDYFLLYTETPDTLYKVPFQCPDKYEVAPRLGFFSAQNKWGYRCWVYDDNEKPVLIKFIDRLLQNTTEGTVLDMTNIYLTGKATQGNILKPNDKNIYLPVTFDISKRPVFSVELPLKYQVKKEKYSAIISNDDKYSILFVSSNNPPKGEYLGHFYGALYYKTTGQWRDIDLKGNASVKMVYGDWLAGYLRDGMDIDVDYYPDAKKSPGRALRDSAKLDYEYQYYLINSDVYAPGILYLLNLQTLKYIEWNTGQGDSEILLVENETVYYRVFDQIFKVKIINGEKLGTPVLLAKDTQIVPFIHWAFLSAK